MKTILTTMLAFFVMLTVATAGAFTLEVKDSKGTVLYSGPMKERGTFSISERGDIAIVKVKNAQGIEVLSWSWGASNSAASVQGWSFGASNPTSIGSSGLSAGKSSGGGAGKASMSDLSVTDNQNSSRSNNKTAESTTGDPIRVGDVKAAREAGSGMATGRRQYEPIIIGNGRTTSFDATTPAIRFDLSGNTVTFVANSAAVASYDLKAAKK